MSIIERILAWEPHHTVPDGSVLFAHHFTQGVMAAAFVLALLWNDHRGESGNGKEPAIIAGGLVVSTFGFLFAWNTAAILGVVFTLGGLGLATGGLLRQVFLKDLYGRRALAGIALGLAWAWDDAIEHAFGVWTPLDFIWNTYLLPLM